MLSPSTNSCSKDLNKRPVTYRTMPLFSLDLLFDFMAALSINLIVSLSLNLECGYCGVSDFGRVFAVLGGAVIAAAIPGRLIAWYLGLETGVGYVKQNAYIITEINRLMANTPALAIGVIIFTLAISFGIGTLMGLFLSFPALRLRVHYLAITLFALGEIFRLIFYNTYSIVGGTVGIEVPNVMAWLPPEYRFPLMSIFLLFMSLLVFFYVKRTTDSPLGRVLRAIKDNEDVARTFGKEIVRVRMKTIMISAGLAAVAGALYTFYAGAMVTSAFTAVSWTFIPIVMIVIGGLGNNLGTVVGTTIVVLINKSLVYVKHTLRPFLPFDVVWLDYLLLGILLIIIQLYMPQGILKEKPIRTIDFDKFVKGSK